MELICRLFSLETAVHYFWEKCVSDGARDGIEPNKVTNNSEEGFRSFSSCLKVLHSKWPEVKVKQINKKSVMLLIHRWD